MDMEIEMRNGPNIVLDGQPAGFTLAARREMREAVLDYLRAVWAEVRADEQQRALLERLIDRLEDWDIEGRDARGWLGGGPLGRLG